MLNVLIVDDSAVMRFMIAKTLRLCGVPLGQILEAGNGLDALALLRDRCVDLAMVDVNMPGMDGAQLIAAIRADERLAALAVIVVSTEGSEARIEELTRLGAAFVHKPFPPEELRATILRVTRGARCLAS